MDASRIFSLPFSRAKSESVSIAEANPKSIIPIRELRHELNEKKEHSIKADNRKIKGRVDSRQSIRRASEFLQEYDKFEMRNLDMRNLENLQFRHNSNRLQSRHLLYRSDNNPEVRKPSPRQDSNRSEHLIVASAFKRNNQKQDMSPASNQNAFFMCFS